MTPSSIPNSQVYCESRGSEMSTLVIYGGLLISEVFFFFSLSLLRKSPDPLLRNQKKMNFCQGGFTESSVISRKTTNTMDMHPSVHLALIEPQPKDAHISAQEPSKTPFVLVPVWCSIKLEMFLGRHVVRVWIGGVWNGHLPEPEKYFSEAEISRKIPEIQQRERERAIFDKCQAPKFEKFEAPKKCNSILPAIPYPH